MKDGQIGQIAILAWLEGGEDEGYEEWREDDSSCVKTLQKGAGGAAGGRRADLTRKLKPTGILGLKAPRTFGRSHKCSIITSHLQAPLDSRPFIST